MYKILCKHNSLPNPWSILPRETASNQSDTHNHFHGSETKTFANWCIWTSAQTVHIENCSCSRVSCKFVNILYIYIFFKHIHINWYRIYRINTRSLGSTLVTTSRFLLRLQSWTRIISVKYGIAVGAQTTKRYCDAD